MAFPAIAHSAVVDNSSTSSLSQATTWVQTANRALFALAQWDNGVSLNSVTDNYGHTYYKILSHLNSSNVGIAAYWTPRTKAAASGAITITAAFSGLCAPELYIFDVSDPVGNGLIVDFAPPLFNDGSGVSTTTCGPMITTFANELLIAYQADATVSATGPGTGWTGDTNSPTGFGAELETQTQASAGASVTATTAMGSATTGYTQILFGIAPAQTPFAQGTRQLSPWRSRLSVFVNNPFYLTYQRATLFAGPAGAAPAGVNVQPAGLDPQELFGAFAGAIVIAPAGALSFEVFGADASALSVTSSVSPVDALGADALAVGVTSSTATAESFGADTAAVGVTTLTPPLESFGADTAAVGVSSLTPSGEREGASTAAVVVLAAGLSTEERLGTDVLVPVVTAQPAGIATNEGFGTPATALGVSAAGVSTFEAFGAEVAALDVTSSSPPTDVFGADVLVPAVVVEPSGLATEERFGAPTSAVGLLPSGAESREAAGAASGGLVVTSVASPAETFGPFASALTVLPSGAAVEERFGFGLASVILAPAGLDAREGWGAPVHVPLLYPASLSSFEQFSADVLALAGSASNVNPASLSALEVFGAFTFVSSLIPLPHTFVTRPLPYTFVTRVA